jgi:hypothetical protein
MANKYLEKNRQKKKLQNFCITKSESILEAYSV